MRLGGGEGVAAARREWRRRPGSESARGRTQRFVGAVRRRGGPVKKAAAAPRVGVGVGGGMVQYFDFSQLRETTSTCRYLNVGV